MKNKHSSKRGSQKLEHSRATCKSSTETVALIECIFCGEKGRDLPKMSKKQKQSLKLHAAGEGNTIQVFRVLMCSMLSQQLNNGEKWLLY